MALPSALSTRDCPGLQAWPPGRGGTGLGAGAALSAALPWPCDAAGRPPRVSPSSGSGHLGASQMEEGAAGRAARDNQGKTQEDAARPSLVVGERRAEG